MPVEVPVSPVAAANPLAEAAATPSSVLSAPLPDAATPQAEADNAATIPLPAGAASASSSASSGARHLSVPILPLDGAAHPNESTEPAAASSSPLISAAAPLVTGPMVASPTAGLSPLSNLSDEESATKVEAVTAASPEDAVAPAAAPSASARPSSPTRPVSSRVSPQPLSAGDLLPTDHTAPSLNTLANLNTLNANLSQNLSDLNSTIASLTNMTQAGGVGPTGKAAGVVAATSAAASALTSSPKQQAQLKKEKKDSPVDMSCQSMIECGEFLPNGKRNMTAYVDFFGKEVEIYTAVGDVHRRHLYRASALAEKFGYATNKVGMYLARRRSAMSGIYQATSFRAKPPGRTGLKAGGYFLTMCLRAGTLVVRADGERVPCETIQPGDSLLGEGGKMVRALSNDPLPPAPLYTVATSIGNFDATREHRLTVAWTANPTIAIRRMATAERSTEGTSHAIQLRSSYLEADGTITTDTETYPCKLLEASEFDWEEQEAELTSEEAQKEDTLHTQLEDTSDVIPQCRGVSPRSPTMVGTYAEFFQSALARLRDARVLSSTAGGRVMLLNGRVFEVTVGDLIRHWKEWCASSATLVRPVGVPLPIAGSGSTPTCGRLMPPSFTAPPVLVDDQLHDIVSIEIDSPVDADRRYVIAATHSSTVGILTHNSACREFEHHFRQHDEMLGSTMPIQTPAAHVRPKKQPQPEVYFEEEVVDEDEHEEPAADEEMAEATEEKAPLSKAARLRISSSEAEASANLALLAQFSPPPNGAAAQKPPAAAGPKKRSADAANLTLLTPAQIALTIKRPPTGSVLPARRPIPGGRQFDSLAIPASGQPSDPAYQPGLSPLSPLSPATMATQMGMDQKSSAAATSHLTHAATAYTFDPLKLEADVGEIMAQQQFQAHANFMHHHQQNQFNHLLGSPPPPRNHMYANNFGSFAPLGSPFPNQYPQMGGGGGKNQMTINPNVGNPNGGANFLSAQTPFMPTPMGGMMSPMPSFSPFPGQSSLMSPNPGFPYGQPSSVQMHQPPGQPMSVTVSYNVVLHPNGSPAPGSNMNNNLNGQMGQMGQMSGMGSMPFANGMMFTPQANLLQMPNFGNFLSSPNPMQFSPPPMQSMQQNTPVPVVATITPPPPPAVPTVKSEPTTADAHAMPRLSAN